ncbi:histidine kinase [Oryzisolibacter sp. LB2S]|uniref:sensor histidine kinase n=1 Tax=Alicycliphilus soli TaxID=3228789 RepID=UPI0034583FF0
MRTSLPQQHDSPKGPPREHWWQRLNPWRHFAAALGWAMFALVVAGAVVAAEWAASEAERHVAMSARARLQQTANQTADALLAQLQTRLAAMRATAAQWALSPGDTPAALLLRLQALQVQQPELGWIGVLDATDRWLAATGPWPQARALQGQPWLARARRNPLVVLHRGQGEDRVDALVLAVPLVREGGGAAGVLVAQLPWLWLQAELDARLRAIGGGLPMELLLTGAGGRVLAGPPALQGLAADADLAEGGHYLVARSDAPGAYEEAQDAGFAAASWRLWVREDARQALAPARQTHRAVLVGVLAVGLLAALAAVLVARRLLRRLNLLAEQARAVRAGTRDAVDLPAGRDEVHGIGVTLAQLIGHWQEEKAALTRLNAELDMRVAARTAHIERLAQDARRAAVTRERLRLARGLHDTLAQSLMALLTQVRLMRKLGAQWSRERLDAELRDAEKLAADGLAEARAVIGQMRDSEVHDSGLGPALQALLHRFSEDSGVHVRALVDPASADLVSERAATVLNMVRELLRNVRRHAGASTLALSLQPEEGGDADADMCWRLTLTDDGRGFDPAAVPPGHYGLQGLREQAQQIGAQLALDSAPGQGCRVRLRFAA